MAQTVKPGDVGYPDKAPTTDWSQWADGQVWLLTRGEDFPQCPARARFALRRFAQRRNLSVSTSIISENTLRVCLTPRS